VEHTEAAPKMGLVLGHRMATLLQGVELIELMLNEFLRQIPLWNCSSNSSHDMSSTTMFKSGRSVFHHRRALPFSQKTTMKTFMLEVIIMKHEAQRLSLQPCLDDTAVWDTLGLENSTLSSSRWMLMVLARARCGPSGV
jgi:hypothetical protein